MPSGSKMRRVCKDARHKNLAVLAETLRQNRFFPAKLSGAPENAGENHDISFEAPFTLSIAGRIDMLFFRCFCLYLWLLIVPVNVISCQVTL